MEKGGCFIFLSHSSKDINIVRKIRNKFESLNQNPLAFHLRCLDEYYPHRDTELWNLIYKEIDAREWFVFCNSPNSQKSENVLREREYVLQSGKTKIWEIDITKDWNTISNKIARIVEDLEVFISYSRRDREIAKKIKKYLVDADYSVWDAEDQIVAGDFWGNEIESAIERCARKGFYLILITENSVNSEFILRELSLAVKLEATIIPVIIGNPEIPRPLSFLIDNYYQLRCSDERKLEDLLSYIDESMQKKIDRLNQL